MQDEAFNAISIITEMIQEHNYAHLLGSFFEDLFSVYSTQSEKEILPDQIEPNYVGIHLNNEYEEGDFLKMIEGFKNKQIIHAKYAMKIVNDAINLFEQFPNVSECNMKKAKTNLPAIIIVGDLHGSFKDLYYIIQKCGIPGKNYRFVFNGDFVDRGSQQCEVLLTLLYCFLMYPSRVFLNRGNHEDLFCNMNKNFDPNFRQNVNQKFNKYGLAFFNQVQRLFRRLPIATVVENNVGFRCFVVHGGISNRIDLNYVYSNKLNRFSFPVITISQKDSGERKKAAEQFTDLLWSDPLVKSSRNPNSTGCYPNKNRGIGWLFGEDESEKFCRKYGFNMIIRSHEVRDNGFSPDHPFCSTIFSASNYNSGTNQAAVFILDANQYNLSVHSFKTIDFHTSDAESQKKILLSDLKSYLEKESVSLMQKFRNKDPYNYGQLPIQTWANIISEHLTEHHAFINSKYIIYFKDNLCPCDDNTQTAFYKLMFSSSNNNQSSSQLFDFLDNVFSLIDLDHNGFISLSEAEQAITLMNKTLGTNYATEFIYSMDLDKNGGVDFEEFKNGFAKAFNLK